jgi:hypothetical protein
MTLNIKFSISHSKAIQYLKLKGNSVSHTLGQFSISHFKAIKYIILKSKLSISHLKGIQTALGGGVRPPPKCMYAFGQKSDTL